VLEEHPNVYIYIYIYLQVFNSIQEPAGQPASRQVKSSEEQSKRVCSHKYLISADGRRL